MYDLFRLLIIFPISLIRSLSTARKCNEQQQNEGFSWLIRPLNVTFITFQAASVAFSYRGKLWWSKHVGHLNYNDTNSSSPNNDTPYPVASITKVFTVGYLNKHLLMRNWLLVPWWWICQKAFDCLRHDLLIAKVHAYSFSDNAWYFPILSIFLRP